MRGTDSKFIGGDKHFLAQVKQLLSQLFRRLLAANCLPIGEPQGLDGVQLLRKPTVQLELLQPDQVALEFFFELT